MINAEAAAQGALRRIQRNQEENGQHLMEAEEGMKQFLAKVGTISSTLKKRLLDTKANSDKRLSFLQSWQEGAQKTSAETLEQLAELMKTFSGAANRRFWREHQRLEDFALRLAER